MHRVWWFGWVLLALVWAAGPTYTNPVVLPVAADPDVIRGEDGYFYLLATQDDWGNGQGVHLLPIFRSSNLVDWTYVADAFELPPAWKEGGGFVWAPDLSYFGGQYYLYYASSLWGDPNPCIGLATAPHPAGPYRELGRPVFCSTEIGVANSIDPFVFNDPQQRVLFWGSFNGIYAVGLSREGTRTVGEKREVADARFEAPFVYKHGGYYYLFVSVGSCCRGLQSSYALYVGRSRDLWGPYLDASGLDLRYGGGELVLQRNEAWVGPGHNSLIRDDAGQDWLLYHAIPHDNPYLSSGANRRPALLDRVEWRDGWPVINGGAGPSSTPQQGPVVGPSR